MASTLLLCKQREDVSSERSVTAREQITLNDLPDEMLLKILSHFGPEELCLIIAKVCKRWNVLAKDVVLWKTLSYHCDHSSDMRYIKEVLTMAPALHSLIILRRGDVADINEFLFHKHVDLRKLILHDCGLDEDDTGLLENIVDLCRDLEILSLERSKLTSADYCLIPHLKKLSELNLSLCEGLSGETVRLIADSCQHLKKLNLFGAIEILDDDLIHVISRLGKQLTTLVLHGGNLTDVAYSYLNNCARLPELEVSACLNMTERGLLEGIGSLHDLTSLRLIEGLNLTAQALSTFLHGPSVTSIVFLDLSHCFTLDDEGLKGIAESCIHLRDLRVAWCPFLTDTGISIVIKHCTQLRLLDFSCIRTITGEGWLTLVPSYLPHLRELSLVNCSKLCNDFVREVKAALQELIVMK